MSELAYFDRAYIDDVWVSHPTLESLVGYIGPYFTPEMAGAYEKWDRKFFTARMEESEESLEYLAKHPLGERLKRKRDLHYAIGEVWKSEYGSYRACVDALYSLDMPFLGFADFQKAKAVFTEVECDRVGTRCDAVPLEQRHAAIGRCRLFPDWREGDEVARDDRTEELGRKAALPE